MRSRPDEYPAQVEYCIDSASETSFALWKEWHDAVKWEQVNPGFWQQIGEGKNTKGKKMPICVAVDYVRIDGHLVAFIHGTSQLVDYEAIEEWRKKTFKNSKGSTDYMNFSHCLHALGIKINKKMKKCEECGVESWR